MSQRTNLAKIVLLCAILYSGLATTVDNVVPEENFIEDAVATSDAMSDVDDSLTESGERKIDAPTLDKIAGTLLDIYQSDMPVNQSEWNRLKEMAAHGEDMVMKLIDHHHLADYGNHFEEKPTDKVGNSSLVQVGCSDRTLNGGAWYDSDGTTYNCNWYAQGSNCNVHGNGYRNQYTANEACCACGGGNGGYGGACSDSPSGWYDRDGPTYSCSWYAAGRCASHGNGYANFGKTANQACCDCGGGSPPGPPVSPPPPPPPPPCPDMHTSNHFNGNIPVFKQATIECHEQLQRVVDFVEEVDDTMKQLAEMHGTASSINSVTSKLKKVLDKISPFTKSVPKLGAIVDAIKQINEVLDKISEIIKKVLAKAPEIQEEYTEKANEKTQEAWAEISPFKDHAVQMLDWFQSAMTCSDSFKCTHAHAYNAVADQGTNVWQYGPNIGNAMRHCATYIQNVMDWPMQQWERFKEKLDSILDNDWMDHIRSAVAKVEEFAEKMSGDLVAVFQAVKCCTPDFMQVGLNGFAAVIDVLFCPFTQWVGKLEDLIMEFANKFVNTILDMIPDAYETTIGVDLGSYNTYFSVPSCSGHIGFNLDLDFSVSIGTRSLKNAIANKLGHLSSDESSLLNSSPFHAMQSFAYNAAVDCWRIASDRAKSITDTCDCDLWGALKDLHVVKMSAEVYNFLKSHGHQYGSELVDKIDDFQDWAGDHIGDKWDDVTDGAGNFFSSAGSTVGGWIGGLGEEER